MIWVKNKKHYMPSDYRSYKMIKSVKNTLYALHYHTNNSSRILNMMVRFGTLSHNITCSHLVVFKYVQHSENTN